MKKNTTTIENHKAVLLREVVELFDQNKLLQHKTNPVIYDGTFGAGGHSRKLLEKFPNLRIIASDKDPSIINSQEELISKFNLEERLELFHGDFLDMENTISESKFKIEKVDGILLDIGVSSMQLDNAQRGFSFMNDGPLDMRMNTDPSNKLTAAEIINKTDEKKLADLFFHYGEERMSRKIAKAIAHDRKSKPFTSTRQLADMIQRIMPKKGRIHPATRVFQALRIAVNNELSQLEGALQNGTILLNPGARFLVISFHSLEDRIVKNFFRSNKEELKIITKKPTIASAEEEQNNPRARSAKLRCAQKLD